jgi:polysaccharide export outer membrane protein
MPVIQMLRTLRSLSAGALTLAAALAAAGQSLAAEPTGYTLGTGDKVRVTVYNEKDLSGEFDVSDQGTVALPLIGQVAVRGKSPREVERHITEAYGKDYLVNPQVNVEVLNYRPFYIMGEVKNPGSYAYVNGMNVLNAVALAGGYTPRARKAPVYVKRGDRPSEEQTLGDDALVMPGDVIRVAERFF